MAREAFRFGVSLVPSTGLHDLGTDGGGVRAASARGEVGLRALLALRVWTWVLRGIGMRSEDFKFQASRARRGISLSVVVAGGGVGLHATRALGRDIVIAFKSP